MSIVKTTLIVASFVVAATAAHAQVGTNIHGEPAARSQTYTVSPRGEDNRNFRGAFAQEFNAAPLIRIQPQSQQEANPLFDDFHGNNDRNY